MSGVGRLRQRRAPGQFLSQLETEESSDVELSLEQLEDVDGGLGVADVMVSSSPSCRCLQRRGPDESSPSSAEHR